MKTDCLFFFILLILITFVIFPASARPWQTCQMNDAKDYGTPVQVSISDDGQRVFAGSPSSGIVSLFTKDGDAIWVYRTNRTITNVAISEDGRYLYAATVDGEVYGLNNSGAHLWTLYNNGCFPHVVLSPSGSTGIIYNRDNPEKPYYYNFHLFSMNGTMIEEKFDPLIINAGLPGDGEYIVLSKGNGSQMLGMYSGSGYRDLGFQAVGFPTAISKDANTVVVMNPSGFVAYDKSGNRISAGNLTYYAGSVAASPEGDVIAGGTQYNVVNYARNGTPLWDVMTGFDMKNVALSSQGNKTVAVTVNDKSPDPAFSQVFLFSASGTQLWRKPVRDHIGSIAISTSGETIVAGSFNDTVYFFSPEGETRTMWLSSLPNEDLPPTPNPAPVYWRSTPTTSAPLPGMVVIAAVWVCSGIIYWRRNR